MKAGLGTFGSRLPAARYLWVIITILLGLGLITSLVDLFGVSAAETRHAIEHQQRIFIDAATGAVSGADRPTSVKETPSHDFEVGEETPVEPVIAETPPSEEEATVSEPAPLEPLVDAAPETSMPADNAPALATSPMTADIPKIERTKHSLVLAPAPEVSEITPQGALPKRGEGDNVTPAMIYSRSYTRNDEIATLHFVVIGLGFGSDTLDLALSLPPEVSFAFSPYGESLTTQIEAARNAGHEAWIQLPVQSVNYPQDDPGPLGLIASLSMQAFEARLKKMLIAMPGIVGILLPEDETLSANPRVFADLLTQLDERGLIAISTHPERKVKELSGDPKIQKIIARSNLILDDVPNDAVIKSRLAGLMDTTKQRRQMVVVMHARPQTMILVRDWLKRTNYEGVELAPLSATILRPPKMLTPDDVEAAPKEAAGGHGSEAKPAEGGHGGGH